MKFNGWFALGMFFLALGAESFSKNYCAHPQPPQPLYPYVLPPPAGAGESHFSGDAK